MQTFAPSAHPSPSSNVPPPSTAQAPLSSKAHALLEKLAKATSGVINVKNASLCVSIVKEVGELAQNLPVIKAVAGIVTYLIKVVDVCVPLIFCTPVC